MKFKQIEAEIEYCKKLEKQGYLTEDGKGLLKELELALSICSSSLQLLCVNSQQNWDVTEGKLYELKYEAEREYIIIDDLGKEDAYFKKHFKKAESK